MRCELRRRQRTRPCGYSCPATQSRDCSLPPVLVRPTTAPAEGVASTLGLVPGECGRVSVVPGVDVGEGMQEAHEHGGPASSQACPRCYGHREPSEGWASPSGAQRCLGAPPAWPPLFPKVPRTRTPWAYPVRSGSPWPTMPRTCPAQVSVGENLSWEGGTSCHGQESHCHELRQRTHLPVGKSASPARVPSISEPPRQARWPLPA